jgi:tetratricopeptide (TPR) repeat protein
MRTRIVLGQLRRDVLTQLIGKTDTEFAAGWYARALALHALGRNLEAVTSLGNLTRAYPGFCEARAVLAGLRREAGDEAEARKLADAIYQAADAPNGAPYFGRCAAMAAAAMADPDRAATWIGRTASNPAMLHRWTTVNGIVAAQAAIRQRMYPWSNLQKQPAVEQALEALTRAIARSRAEVAKRLDGLLEPSRGVAEAK